MDTKAVIRGAEALVAKAKPGIMKLHGKVYTFVFCHANWHYKVYEDGFLILQLNTKKITEAKRLVRNHIDG